MIGRLTAAVAAAGAACVGYGVWEGASYRVRRVSVPVLPEGARPVRVLHLSDVHLAPGQGRKLDFLRALPGLEPDLVVNTGDNIASPESVDLLVDAFERFDGVPGVFVFGSNDFHGPRLSNPLAYLWRSTSTEGPGAKAGTPRALPTDALRSALESLGWTYLEERSTEITVGDTTLHLRGTGDAHEGRADYAAVAGPVPAGVVGVGVTHAPYDAIVDAMVADGVRLVFAGHTHGGQVCVPGYGALTTNCDLPTDQAKGLSRRGDAWLHVSAGVGMSPMAPYRFACPPEVTLLELVPAAQV